MTATRSEARCRACSVAVHKSDQRRNLANPASKRVAPTFVDSCILHGRWLSQRTIRSCACHASEDLRRLCSTFDREGVANPLLIYHVTAAIWLALSTFQQSTRKPGVLAQTYFVHLAPPNKIRLARETRESLGRRLTTGQLVIKHDLLSCTQCCNVTESVLWSETGKSGRATSALLLARR